MPKKPKREEVEKEGNWSEDQREHEYYYDDAHGYEEYDPEEEEEGELKDDRDESTKGA
jgi:hypothetical protein